MYQILKKKKKITKNNNNNNNSHKTKFNRRIEQQTVENYYLLESTASYTEYSFTHTIAIQL